MVYMTVSAFDALSSIIQPWGFSKVWKIAKKVHYFDASIIINYDYNYELAVQIIILDILEKALLSMSIFRVLKIGIQLLLCSFVVIYFRLVDSLTASWSSVPHLSSYKLFDQHCCVQLLCIAVRTFPAPDTALMSWKCTKATAKWIAHGMKRRWRWPQRKDAWRRY